MVAAIGMTTSLWPGDSGRHRYPAAVVIWINHGVHDWFNATTPFDYGRFRAVDSDARLLFMALVATLAWTVVLRRLTLISIALGLVLFAFPSTVLNLEHSLVRAAWFLARGADHAATGAAATAERRWVEPGLGGGHRGGRTRSDRVGPPGGRQGGIHELAHVESAGLGCATA